VSGVGSGIALAGFNKVKNPRSSDFTAGDPGCHAENDNFFPTETLGQSLRPPAER